MFPVTSTESIFSGDMNPLTYRDVVIYDEGGRLLSPSAVHHIDIYDDIDESGDRNADERNADDDTGDGYRTGRFSPR
ncbi:hypothetical protein [Natronorubrum halophilum]|uniref:hypothetical protein n=1 Tax=Natronorubrum halophilum TaxID=1702106 RepID=UPI001EE922F4|nr:hypothetical protein [Natronorubrum halophilum]